MEVEIWRRRRSLDEKKGGVEEKRYNRAALLQSQISKGERRESLHVPATPDSVWQSTSPFLLRLDLRREKKEQARKLEKGELTASLGPAN